MLLLGVTHENNTSLHLAEYRTTWPGKSLHGGGAPVLVDFAVQWIPAHRGGIAVEAAEWAKDNNDE